MMRLYRKTIILLMISLILLAGCTTDVSTSDNSPKQQVRLKFICLPWQKTCISAFKEVIEEWNKENPSMHVDYIQGDWRKIGNDMITAFNTGDVPDLIHYWASPIISWSRAGYLADLNPIIDNELRNDIDDDIWSLFEYNEETYAIPFMHEVDLIVYNKKLFREKKITPPSKGNPWNFNQLKNAAKKLTDPKKGIYGMAIGLGQASRHLNEMFAIKWGLSPVSKNDGKAKIKVTPEYKRFMKEIYNLIYVDKVMSQEMLLLNPEHIAPGFVEGKYAMLPGIGCWVRSQIIEHSQGTDLEWGVLPTFKVQNQSCFGAIQTISIPRQAKHKKEAMSFLRFMAKTENMAKIAYGDFLFPVRNSAFNLPEFSDKKYGWKLAKDMFKNVTIPNYVDVPGYQEFMDNKGVEIYLRYLGGKININEFAEQLETEGNKVIGDYSRFMSD